VERHEHFEELAAAASVGEAKGAELAELEEHLRGCPDCRQSYADFLGLGSARMVAEANKQEEVTGPEAIGYIDSALFRERFLKKAVSEGILSSGKNVDVALPHPAIRPIHRGGYRFFALGVAASLLVALGAGVVYRGKSLPSAASPANKVKRDASAALPTQSVPPDQSRDALLSHLAAENRKLTSEISSLKVSLAQESSALEEWKTRTASSEKDSVALLSAAKERDARIGDLERELDKAQTDVAGVRTELEKVQASHQSIVVADQTRMQQLSDQLAEQSSALERERDMLAANRDIRDLMSARNLHIADIFDTDTKGKTRAAFGRVFFTEGKSLLIYAYDLNDRRVQEAGYHYRVWGKKEVPGQGAKSLGIFYSDDKTQKRWVFKYEDPKVLSEIDSVFVTLEPPGKNPTEPKGDKFLYAYLRNQPNHP
jgi:hypothetical protein